MLKQPLWVACAIYAAYIGLGDGACEKANRAVNPIHWVGLVASWASSNVDASNHTGKLEISGVDKAAGTIRDAILVVTVGKAYCTSYESSVRAVLPKELPIPTETVPLLDSDSSPPTQVPPPSTPSFKPLEGATKRLDSGGNSLLAPNPFTK